MRIKLHESCVKIYDCPKLDISYIVLYVLQHNVNSKNNFYKKIETKLNLTSSCKIESSYFLNISRFHESLHNFYDCHELHFSYIGLLCLQHSIKYKNNFYKKIETKLNLTSSCKYNLK